MKILVLSDVHSNKYALDTILKHARKIDYTIFLGDAVDYGPHPAEVIDILRENVDIWIMGNHDNAVAFNVDCKCSQELHDLSVYTRENITLKLISDDQKKFLQNLPIRKEIEVEPFQGLLVDFVKRKKAKVVIRGLRAISDFEYEFQMALMNRKLNPEIETFFMMPSIEYSFLSSRLVKEVFSLGGCIKNLVPPIVEEKLRKKLRKI